MLEKEIERDREEKNRKYGIVQDWKIRKERMREKRGKIEKISKGK